MKTLTKSLAVVFAGASLAFLGACAGNKCGESTNCASIGKSCTTDKACCGKRDKACNPEAKCPVSGQAAIKGKGCCGSCGTDAAKPAKAEVDHKISTADLAALIASKPEKLYILDALVWNDKSVKIPGAHNVNSQTSDEKIHALIKDKNAHIITYCANERCSASPELLKRLKKLGYTNVHEYPAGIQGWTKAGMATEKAL
ncbi:MAG: rhodanese-like domain-containing protein [Victivallales bacterium]|nr:rhodanese-like domain-containing protein [Victivallales bacterium]